MASKTSAIAVDVASDKSLTNRLLDSAGLPVPRSDVVDGRGPAMPPPAGWASRCVVKPLDGNHGRGVDSTCAPTKRSGPRFTLPRQRRAGDVVVETYLAGNDYRCLVIGGRVAAVAERVPAIVPATASTPSPSSSRSRTTTRVAASATRRC